MKELFCTVHPLSPLHVLFFIPISLHHAFKRIGRSGSEQSVSYEDTLLVCCRDDRAICGCLLNDVGRYHVLGHNVAIAGQEGG